jgi:hypothetical protein
VLDVEGVGGDGEKLVEVLYNLVLCRRWEHNAVHAPSGLAGDELPVSMVCCVEAKDGREGEGRNTVSRLEGERSKGSRAKRNREGGLKGGVLGAEREGERKMREGRKQAVRETE